MTQRIEYVNPTAIEFRNELDLVDLGVEDPHDQDVLVIHYDEIVIIPGGYDAQYELGETIRRTIKAQTGKDGRAVRTGDQLPREVITVPALDDAGEVVVGLANGFTLRSGGEQFTSGEYVRLCNPDGAEVRYWDQEEWRTDPALVMGAILNSAATAATA